jgi:hypothetical protein
MPEERVVLPFERWRSKPPTLFSGLARLEAPRLAVAD